MGGRGGLTDLRGLRRSARVTGAGLGSLKGCTKLHKLALTGGPVVGKGLADLQQSPALDDLDLWASQVTDADMEHIEGSKG